MTGVEEQLPVMQVLVGAWRLAFGGALGVYLWALSQLVLVPMVGDDRRIGRAMDGGDSTD